MLERILELNFITIYLCLGDCACLGCDTERVGQLGLPRPKLAKHLGDGHRLQAAAHQLVQLPDTREGYAINCKHTGTRHLVS